MMPEEKRLHARASILGSVFGRLVPLDVSVIVEDMSLGGMRIRSDSALQVGSSHAFELTIADQAVVRLAGNVVHSRKVTDESGEHYVSGIRFSDQEPENVARVMLKVT